MVQFVLISATIAQTNELLSPENRIKFGDYLFRQKDYLRAVLEYQSVLNSTKNDTVIFKMAYAFDKMGRYSEASDVYKSLMFNSSIEETAKIYFLRNSFLQGDYSKYYNLASNDLYKPKKFQTESEKLSNFSLLYMNEKLPERNDFLSFYSDSDKEIIIGFYDRKLNPGNKDPLTAGILSAIIPGAGKIYTEEYTDGITAFLLTGVLAYLAVDNLQDDHNTRGWIFAGLATYFYAGNIYGSVASAQIFNARIEFNLMDEITKFLGKQNHFLPNVEFIQ